MESQGFSLKTISFSILLSMWAHLNADNSRISIVWQILPYKKLYIRIPNSILETSAFQTACTTPSWYSPPNPWQPPVALLTSVYTNSILVTEALVVILDVFLPAPYFVLLNLAFVISLTSSPKLPIFSHSLCSAMLLPSCSCAPAASLSQGTDGWNPPCLEYSFSRYLHSKLFHVSLVSV